MLVEEKRHVSALFPGSTGSLPVSLGSFAEMGAAVSVGIKLQNVAGRAAGTDRLAACAPGSFSACYLFAQLEHAQDRYLCAFAH